MKPRKVKGLSIMQPEVADATMLYLRSLNSDRRRSAKAILIRKLRHARKQGIVDVFFKGFEFVSSSISAWHGLDDRLPEVTAAYNRVRNELCEVGLLDEGVYLDQIRLEVSLLPSLGEAGYVYDGDPGLLTKLVGYEEGVIYLPADVPQTAYVPGGTLTDVIRHEFAHAWYWLEPDFFDREWFRDAFSVDYDIGAPIPRLLWEDKLLRSRSIRKQVKALKTEVAKQNFIAAKFKDEFVSDYAATQACEDFAETFMIYLRYRNSLGRFKKRSGVYRKLRAVEKAVKVARRELDL